MVDTHNQNARRLEHLHAINQRLTKGYPGMIYLWLPCKRVHTRGHGVDLADNVSHIVRDGLVPILLLMYGSDEWIHLSSTT